MSTALYEVKNISKSYGSVVALSDVSLKIHAGEVIGLVGDNGAGKSTLIKCIAGIYTADSGDIFFEGNKVEIQGPRDSTALGIEVVYQDLALCENLDIVQNMFLGHEELMSGTLNEPDMEQKATKALQSLSVKTVKSVRQKVSSLSGGQRQRIALARALAVEPKVLLLDEPTSALDPISTAKIEELINELKHDYTIVIVTHNMQQAARVSDFTAYMYLGNLIEFGKTDEIFIKPKRKETEDYITGRFG